MRFLRPEFANWWQLLPVLFACCTVHALYLVYVRRRPPIASRFARLSRRSNWARTIAVMTAAMLMGGCLVFALARPQASLTERTPEYERQDLVLILDRSASMRAHDVSPSRFSRAVAEIKNFLQHKPESIDRVGLVGFAGGSLVLSYLTSDLDTVAFFLDWVDQDPQTLLGTNIGAALKNATEVATRDDRKTNKIFLLISDGEDYGGELERQVAAYRAAGLRVHCIGIGSDSEVPIPVREPDGRETPLRDDDGRIVRTRFEESTLRQIAAATGGEYVRSTTGNELVKAINDIALSERKIVGWRTTTDYRDLYPEALAAAAAAGVMLWILF
ncbi:MAG TPA: VWA domain-containing protein [Vicinamibacterales bacterium]|jgi:Ca-activated chloride channel family protein|nr:VWA domain-containing protein [Vicinamibacterales bacterium]